MKKRNVWPVLALALLVPGMGLAQENAGLFSAVGEGLVQGLETGAAMAYAGMAQELELTITPEQARLEEGKAMRLTVTAANPRPQSTQVAFDLKLPARLSAAPDTAWTAELPAAQLDEETGVLTPSVTTFTREVLLVPGGDSETVEITLEMGMGTRFYRANTVLELCVPDVTATAAVVGAPQGRLTPGDAMTYELEVINSGNAPKDVAVELTLPDGVALTGELPAGFAQEESVIRGSVRAEAAMTDAAGASPFAAVISLPVRVNEDALDGDEDALRLLSGALTVDGAQVPLPKVQVCAPLISAQLITDAEKLQAGETAQLRVVVVNAGLAEADVKLSCMLPEGLRLAEQAPMDATPGEAVATLPPRDPDAAVLAVDADAARTLEFDLHMDAAKLTQSGVTAATRVIELDVIADEPQENARERLVGTALAWRVDDGDAQLGEAVAMRVMPRRMLGLSGSDMSAILWSSVLLLVTVSLLYAAVHSDGRKEDFCCE